MNDKEKLEAIEKERIEQGQFNLNPNDKEKIEQVLRLINKWVLNEQYGRTNAAVEDLMTLKKILES